MTAASDALGAAAGALLVGVVLLPVMGVGGACLTVAGLKGMGLLVMGGLEGRGGKGA